MSNYFKNLMIKIRERSYINRIRKAILNDNAISFLYLNSLKSQAAKDGIQGKITRGFYKQVFESKELGVHFVNSNIDFILNYK